MRVTFMMPGLACRLSVSVAFAVATSSGFLIARSVSSSEPYTATGTVQCASNAKPVGVWVSAAHGDSGWATIRADRAAPPTVGFMRRIPHGGPYMLDVGCGGTPTQWAV